MLENMDGLPLKEGLLEEEFLSELKVIAIELKDYHDLYLWNQRRIEPHRLQTETYLCNQAIEVYTGTQKCHPE